MYQTRAVFSETLERCDISARKVQCSILKTGLFVLSIRFHQSSKLKTKRFCGITVASSCLKRFNDHDTARFSSIPSANVDIN